MNVTSEEEERQVKEELNLFVLCTGAATGSPLLSLVRLEKEKSLVLMQAEDDGDELGSVRDDWSWRIGGVR